MRLENHHADDTPKPPNTAASPPPMIFPLQFTTAQPGSLQPSAGTYGFLISLIYVLKLSVPYLNFRSGTKGELPVFFSRRLLAEVPTSHRNLAKDCGRKRDLAVAAAHIHSGARFCLCTGLFRFLWPHPSQDLPGHPCHPCLHPNASPRLSPRIFRQDPYLCCMRCHFARDQ